MSNAWADALVERCVADPARPSDRTRGAILAPRAFLTAQTCPAESALDFWLWLQALGAPPRAGSRTEDIAFTLVCSVFWAGQVETELRTEPKTYRIDPARDDLVREAFVHWFEGRPVEAGEIWSARFLRPSRSVFRALFAKRGAPAADWRRVAADHQDAFFYQFYLPTPVPGWAEIAVRVLEDAGVPLAGLAAHLPDEAREAAGEAIACRGSMRATARRLYPDCDWITAGHRLAAATRADPATLDAALDVHLALRLMDRWSKGERIDREEPLTILRTNYGIARARLRALVAANVEGVRDALLRLPALAARTDQAIRWYSRDWASREFPGFSFRAAPVDPPCTYRTPARPPYTEDETSQVRVAIATLLLKCTRMVDDLPIWARCGRLGRKDATWSLWLSSLPDPLQDPPRPGRSHRTRYRLRAHLDDDLCAIYTELLPSFRRISLLDPAPTSWADFEASLTPIWHDAIPFPPRNYASKYIAHAPELVRRIERWLEERCQ